MMKNIKIFSVSIILKVYSSIDFGISLKYTRRVNVWNKFTPITEL